MLLLIQACYSQESETWSEYIRDFQSGFQIELRSSGSVGASYSVFTGDSLIFSGNYGYSNLKNEEETSLITPFLIGSVTKVFTAVAILQLAENELIDLDAPLTDYLPGFGIRQRFEDSGPITVRSLLTHQAGIPSDRFLNKFCQTPPPFTEVIDYLNNQYTCFPVERITAYSNLGYAVLGVVIEQVSGKTYTSYILDSIFTPLGMEMSGFYEDGTIDASYSMGYDRSGKEFREMPLFDLPAGGIYSTIHDMTLFGQSFLGKEPALLRQESLHQMFSLQNAGMALDLDDRTAICFTFRNKAFELGRVYEHGGSTLFHRAQLYIAPDAGLGAVMLSNSPEGTANAWKLNEELMVRYIKQFPGEIADIPNPHQPVHFTSVESKQLENFTGTYAMPGMLCRFDWKDNLLYPTIQGNSFYLVPEDEHAFVPAKKIFGRMARSREMWFFLEEIEGEKIFIQAMNWGDLVIIGRRLEPRPVPPLWKERLGLYAVANHSPGELPMIHDLELLEKEEHLVLQYRYHEAFGNDSPVEMVLEYVSDSVAFIAGWGRGGGEGVFFRESSDQTGPVLEYMGLEAVRTEISPVRRPE